MSSLDVTEANSSGTPGVKPTERDDLADNVDEPPQTKLDDYSDPNAIIASILSDPNQMARRDARSVNNICQIVGSHDATHGNQLRNMMVLSHEFMGS